MLPPTLIFLFYTYNINDRTWSFDLHLDHWFVGCLNGGREIFGECNEILGDGYLCCGLIHLCDQKFCDDLFTQTQTVMIQNLCKKWAKSSYKKEAQIVEAQHRY